MNFHEVPRANDAAEVKDRHQHNQRAWNEAALEYRNYNTQRVNDLRSGKSNLHPIERRNLEKFGPLKEWCHRAIHLQCASGYDTLSLILEGVREVVGLDISAIHIENARWTSEQLNMPALWYCCDVLEAPTALNATADLVYTGRGAINWVHDLRRWAEVVKRLLKPGGVFHLLEDHPVTWLLDREGEDLRASGISHFGYAEASQGWPSSYLGEASSSLGPIGKPVHEQCTKYERLWTIAEVFHALRETGLSIESLGEHPEPYWDAFPRLTEKLREKLPMTFSVVARRIETTA
jgi:SAM-dependent methyltransferase